MNRRERFVLQSIDDIIGIFLIQFPLQIQYYGVNKKSCYVVSDACRRVGAAHEADNSYSNTITSKIAATTDKSTRQETNFEVSMQQRNILRPEEVK